MQTVYFFKFCTTKSNIIITGSNGQTPAHHHGIYLLRVEPHVPLQTARVDCCQILSHRYNRLMTPNQSRNNSIDRSIFAVGTMKKSSEGLYNINNNGRKTITWGVPETTSSDTLTLPFKCTRCLLSLRNCDTIDKSGPLIPLDLSLYNKPKWLTLSNAAEKSNWTSLPSNC